MIRASQGTQVDAMLQANAKGVESQKLYRGFYHSVVPSGSSASARVSDAQGQAIFFYRAVAQVGGWGGRCLNPGVDIEVNPSGLSASEYTHWVGHYLQHLESALGSSWPLKPMLYLSVSTWQNLLGKTQAFTKFPLWAADWGVQHPADFGGWTKWTCWQWSAPGPLTGVPHTTDYDEWHSAQLPAPLSAQKTSKQAAPASSGPSLSTLLSNWETATSALVNYVRQHG